MIDRPLSRRHFLAGSLGLALFVSCAADDLEPTLAPPPSLRSDYPGDDLFAGPEWLMERLDDPSLRLLDVSSLPDYRRGHIPGARHIWWQDTIEIHNPVYGMLVNENGRSAVVDEAGISSDSTVVCYDDAGGVYAARLIWMLQFMGFSAARLLNGGIQGWKASGYDVTLEEPDVSEGGFEQRNNELILAHGHDILERLDEPGLIIVDTRTADERRETWDGHLREGQIPNSIWIPRTEFLTPTPVPALIPVSQLRSIFRSFDIPPDSVHELIVYGLHGTLGCLPYLAFLALDDFRIRLYDGAWAEWGANSEWPVEAIS